MTDYLGQSKWALTRRASRWPLIRLVCVVFVLGVCFGVALSFAISASGLTVDTKTAARLDPGVSRSGPDAVRANTLVGSVLSSKNAEGGFAPTRNRPMALRRGWNPP